ncbi:hypothetical protein DVK01_19625 [Haloarcula sp. Atlit-120R]|nr:hypothetical protein DVK01_19625 [Haloarcula sp. Atlit-120R]
MEMSDIRKWILVFTIRGMSDISTCVFYPSLWCRIEILLFEAQMVERVVLVLIRLLYRQAPVVTVLEIVS